MGNESHPVQTLDAVLFRDKREMNYLRTKSHLQCILMSVRNQPEKARRSKSLLLIHDVLE